MTPRDGERCEKGCQEYQRPPALPVPTRGVGPVQIGALSLRRAALRRALVAAVARSPAPAHVRVPGAECRNSGIRVRQNAWMGVAFFVPRTRFRKSGAHGERDVEAEETRTVRFRPSQLSKPTAKCSIPAGCTGLPGTVGRAP